MSDLERDEDEDEREEAEEGDSQHPCTGHPPPREYVGGVVGDAGGRERDRQHQENPADRE